MSADKFAEGKGYTGAGLRWAESRLAARRGRGESLDLAGAQAGERVEGPIVRAPQFAALRVRPPEATREMIVEVGDARIRVSAGFSTVLLGDIVRALATGGRR
jgi:hypothetical protein